MPDAEGLTPADFERYAAELSRVADVTAVSAPTAAFTGGDQVGPPVAPAGLIGGSAFLTVGTNVPLFSRRRTPSSIVCMRLLRRAIMPSSSPALPR